MFRDGNLYGLAESRRPRRRAERTWPPIFAPESSYVGRKDIGRPSAKPPSFGPPVFEKVFSGGMEMTLQNSLGHIRVESKVEFLVEVGICGIQFLIPADSVAGGAQGRTRREVALLPKHTSPVDADHRLRNPAGRAKILDGSAAIRQGPIIVHDDKASVRNSGIQVFQRFHSGFIHVAIEPQDTDLRDRRGREGVLKPTGQEADLFVEQAVPPEVRLDFLQWDSQIAAELMMARSEEHTSELQ